MGILVDCRPSKSSNSNAGQATSVQELAPVAASSGFPPVKQDARKVGPLTACICAAAALLAGMGLLVFVASSGVCIWLALAGTPESDYPNQVAAAPPNALAKVSVVQQQSSSPDTPTSAPPAAPAPPISKINPVQPAPDIVEDPNKLIMGVFKIAKFEELVKEKPSVVQASTAKDCTTGECKETGDFFGTAVTFRPTPKIAGEEAGKQHKLLFVLHVSGNFEDPGFT